MTDRRLLISLCLGQWEANTVLLVDTREATAAVVDPGQGAADLLPAVLAELHVDLETILLTHGHLDHLWAAPDLARATGAQVRLHPADRWLWDQPAAAFGAPAATLADVGMQWDTTSVDPAPLDDGQRLTVAGIDIEVLHTPGHTPGHVAFLAATTSVAQGIMVGRRIDGLAPSMVAAEVSAEVDMAPPSAATPPNGAALASVRLEIGPETLLSGDLLFAGSIGRTDLARGSTPDMMHSLAKIIDRCDDDVVVVPGHGPATTVGHERRHNPYLGEVTRR